MMRNIIFDWSGVISDDISIVLDTYNELFAKYGNFSLSKTEFQAVFELPYKNFCDKILGSDIPLEELRENFKLIYNNKNRKPDLIQGVENVLVKLKDNNVRMAILSSHSFVSDEAKHYFPQKNYFEKIYEDIPDKTKCIGQLMLELGFNPKSTYYVGDMTHDIDTGKQAGVKTIGITTGYQSRDKLLQAKPDYILDNLDEILYLLGID